MLKITEDQFLNTLELYRPNKLVRWVYKYFSKSTKKEDLLLSQIFTWSLFFLVFLGILFKIIHLYIMTAIVTWIFSITLTTFFVIGIYSIFYNNRRIKKICKKLNIDLKEYHDLYNRYVV